MMLATKFIRATFLIKVKHDHNLQLCVGVHTALTHFFYKVVNVVSL